MIIWALIIFPTIVLLALGVLVVGINRVRDDISDLSGQLEKLTALSLNPRTRFAQATMQSGATTEEQTLSKLGRSSVARRTVVGGDDDSVQKQNLIRGTEVQTDG